MVIPSTLAVTQQAVEGTKQHKNDIETVLGYIQQQPSHRMHRVFSSSLGLLKGASAQMPWSPRTCGNDAAQLSSIMTDKWVALWTFSTLQFAQPRYLGYALQLQTSPPLLMLDWLHMQQLILSLKQRFSVQVRLTASDDMGQNCDACYECR